MQRSRKTAKISPRPLHFLTKNQRPPFAQNPGGDHTGEHGLGHAHARPRSLDPRLQRAVGALVVRLEAKTLAAASDLLRAQSGRLHGRGKEHRQRSHRRGLHRQGARLLRLRLLPAHHDPGVRAGGDEPELADQPAQLSAAVRWCSLWCAGAGECGARVGQLCHVVHRHARLRCSRRRARPPVDYDGRGRRDGDCRRALGVRPELSGARPGTGARGGRHGRCDGAV